MTGHVFRHPARKGACGYQPLSGQPRDAEGRLILEWIYPSPTMVEAAALRAQAETEVVYSNSVPQGSLI